MKIATFIDGGPRTKFGTLMSRHSISCSVTIAPEHLPHWEELMKELAEDLSETDGPVQIYPVDRDKPVPIVFTATNFFDPVDDVQDEPWMEPYYKDLQYMCERDESGMGWVYILP